MIFRTKKALQFARAVVAILSATQGRSALAQDHLNEVQRCKDASECNESGVEALAVGFNSIAVDYYAQQVGYVEQTAHDCEENKKTNRALICKAIPPQPYNNAALAELHGGEPMKARAWLSLAPKGGITEYNKGLVDRSLASFEWPKSPEGQYWKYAGRGLWNQITVTKNREYFDVSLRFYRVLPSGSASGPETGASTETVSISRGSAVLHSIGLPACVMTIRFQTDHVDVETNGKCDLGPNISAGGRYARVSARGNFQDLLNEHWEYVGTDGAVTFSYNSRNVSYDSLGAHVALREFMKGSDALGLQSRLSINLVVFPCGANGRSLGVGYEDQLIVFYVAKDGAMAQADGSPFKQRPMKKFDIMYNSPFATIAPQVCLNRHS